ncbi:MAG: signal peptidase I [Candidatus Omnitrophica bacterium]|nr:signal peptidase I [Candidatus Omnitrophota bacterium]HOX54846.1 signal peptidase I [Candidatus Omnitrophota bacterium]
MNSIELVREAVIANGKVILPFSGKSMYPTLKDAMVVTISRILPESIRIADIIAYQENDQVAAHRVIKIKRDNGAISFITKGDNQPFGGIAEVRQKDLIGRINCAFYADSDGKNILNENIIFRLFYVGLGRIYLFYRKALRDHMPDSLRLFLKTLVGNIYCCFQGCSSKG